MSLPRARNLAILPFAAALTISSAVGPTLASSASRQMSPTAVTSSGLAVATGTVTSASGKAMPGETVDLYAWPSDAVLNALKPGNLVPTTQLGTATTSGSGEYILRVPVARLNAAAVEAGYANLEIFSAVGGIWFFSYQTGSLPDHPSAPVRVNLSPDIGVNCGEDSLGRPYAFSGFSKLKQRNPAWAIVGQGYIAPQKKTKGDSMQFEYDQTSTKSQTSALGLGVSGYGIDAGYNSSGTSTSTATAGQGYPSETASTWFRTLFNTALFRGMCHGLPGESVHKEKQHGYCPSKYEPVHSLVYYVTKCFWMVRSTGWFGPSGSVQHPAHAPATPAKFCGPEARGFVAKTTSQEAIQWSSGFDIGAADTIKGVTLKASFSSSAQTGYDANAQMIFTFGHAGWICGTNHDPNKAAQLVMRGNKT